MFASEEGSAFTLYSLSKWQRQHLWRLTPKEKNTNMTNELSRIPQSFTFDYNAIDRKFTNEAPIIRDIIVYAARKKMRDIWGDLSFTIDDFCNELGYNRTNLQRTLAQFENVSSSDLPMIHGDSHVWDGLFEYALYRALNENIVVSRKRDGVEVIESYQIIERLCVHYKNKGTSRKREKREYSIKISNKLLEKLLDDYFLIDFEDYKNLSSSHLSSVGGYRNFYLYMSRMIATTRYKSTLQQNEKKDHTYIISIDDLCKILNVNFSQANDKKKHIKKTLNYLLGSLKNTPFFWEFVKQGKPYAYYVSFTFPHATISFFNEKLKAVFISKLKEALKDDYIRKDNPKFSGYEIYQASKTIAKDDFMEWFFSPQNRERKDKCFRKVYQQIYHMEYEHDKVSFDNLKLEK